MQEVYASMGHGSLASLKVINKLVSLYKQYHKTDDIKYSKTFVGDKRLKTTEISGLEGIMTNLGRCCSPVPGDEIVGYISRGRGVTIHRADCHIVKALENDRIMQIDWGKQSAGEKYIAVIKVICKNTPGTLSAVSNKIAENKINIKYIYSDTNKNNDAVFNIGIDIATKQELNEFINKLKAMPEVYDVIR